MFSARRYARDQLEAQCREVLTPSRTRSALGGHDLSNLECWRSEFDSDACRSGRLLCQPPRSLPPRHGRRRRQYPTIRRIPFNGAGRCFCRNGYGADGCVVSCTGLCRAYDDAGPVGIDGRGLSGILLRPRGHHTGDVQQATKDAPGREARQTTTIPCVISSTTSNGTSNSMGIVTVQWGGSCSKAWLPTRRRGMNGLCAPPATASKPGSSFGMAH
jgi:hypothetical protein